VPIGTGPGYELRQPPGIAIVGGLIVAQLFTLYTTPVIYLMMDGLRQRRPAPAALPHFAANDDSYLGSTTVIK
jgi:hypothetical protein